MGDKNGAHLYIAKGLLMTVYSGVLPVLVRDHIKFQGFEMRLPPCK